MSQARQHDLSPLSVCRRDFPALDQQVNDHPLAYLDNAASGQQPGAVIEAVARYHQHDHANVHRGVHTLSHRATEAYEGARDRIGAFINARNREQIVLTSGTTESINLVAQSFCRPRLQQGDEILITHMEHHSNIVPWQIVCEQTGATLEVAPINERGELELEQLYALMTGDVRLLAIAHVSNALGTINPIKAIIREAHARDIPVLIDGAQGVPHMPIDVRDLGCDFYAFSGHKMFGPTGTGVLYGRESLLDAMPPYQGGGDMIERVTFEKTTYNTLPHKFEAGTPNIADGIAFGAAIDYLRQFDPAEIQAHEQDILHYATEKLTAIDGLTIVGTAAHKASVISFNLDGVHPFDVGTILDQLGIAVRTGHHCCQPLMDFYGIPGTVRASFAMYNNRQDVDALVSGVERAASMLL